MLLSSFVNADMASVKALDGRQDGTFRVAFPPALSSQRHFSTPMVELMGELSESGQILQDQVKTENGVSVNPVKSL